MKKFHFMGLKFLFVVVFLYLCLALFDTDNITKASIANLSIISSLLPIFGLVIFITTLLNYYLKPKQIVKHIGKESGVKGVFYALASGVLSHGPLYMWYGVLSDMRKAGAKESLLIVFFYARAVKLPLLVFMIDIFGVAFTIILTLYTLLASVLQGYLYNYLNKRF